MKHSYYLLSLGCPKNEVDAEVMAYLLNEAGYRFVTDPKEADYLIVNTCGFIDSAKLEAIEATLDLAAARKDGAKLVMTGCLPQRFMREIGEELPEVDAALGTAEYDRIVETLQALEEDRFLQRIKAPRPGSIAHLGKGRIISSDRPFAYLKVAEGCSNMCAFCAIPYIRGPLTSVPLNQLVQEAKEIEAQGFKELILVAQDTSRYGRDLKGDDKSSLYELCTALLKETSFPWIRLMYTYGDALQKEVIQLMAEEPRLCSYIDMPIQHASNAVLKRMRRRETKEQIADTIDYLRSTVPDLILRTTLLLGFPGETEADVQELLEFLEAHPFDRLGAFAFSVEEGTPAARMDGLPPEAERERRRDLVMAAQQSIAQRQQERRIGSEVDMLIEGVSEDGLFYTARSYGEAPEIDPQIYLLNEYPDDLSIGQIVKGKIITQEGYDLTALRVKDPEA